MMSHKKIHRFLVESLPHAEATLSIGNTITVSDDRIAKQVNRVLKIKPGEQVQIFVDEGLQYTLTLSETTDFSISGTITAIETVAVPLRTVIAAISIVKGDAFEMMVQKLTEIGVSTIVPLVTSRTIKQGVRLNRIQAISDEAVEQSGGTRRVHITDPMTLEECFNAYPYDSVVLDPITTNTTVTKSDTMVCYVGPEGGWNEQDEEIIQKHQVQQLRVSDRVLRTETAVIVGAYTLLQE